MDKIDTETRKQSQYQPDGDQETELPYVQKNNFEHEIKIVNANTKIALDELKYTFLLAHSLADSAIRIREHTFSETSNNPIDNDFLVRWNEFTQKIIEILSTFGNELEGVLKQKLGREVIEDQIEKYKTKILKH